MKASTDYKTNFNWTYIAVNFMTTALALVMGYFFITSSALVAFAVVYVLMGLSLTLGYHRLLTHRSFSVPLWLEYTIAIVGFFAIQRGPIFWASMHRVHHKFTDVPGKDPHSPREGILHVHFGWMQNRREDIWDKEIYRKMTPELNRHALYRFMDNMFLDYVAHLLFIVAAFVIGGFVGNNPQSTLPFQFDLYNAMAWLAWPGLLNRIALLHAFALINSVCHLFGGRPYKIEGEDSTNNFLVASIIMGEGWHNNHHAFPRSARHGLRWYQIDVAWYTILFLKYIGLAKNVYTVHDGKQVKLKELAIFNSNKEPKHAYTDS